MSSRKNRAAIECCLSVVAIALIIGWVMNIIDIFQSEFVLAWILAARLAGIFIVPLGGVLGWL